MLVVYPLMMNSQNYFFFWMKPKRKALIWHACISWSLERWIFITHEEFYFSYTLIEAFLRHTVTSALSLSFCLFFTMCAEQLILLQVEDSSGSKMGINIGWRSCKLELSCSLCWSKKLTMFIISVAFGVWSLTLPIYNFIMFYSHLLQKSF